MIQRISPSDVVEFCAHSGVGFIHYFCRMYSIEEKVKELIQLIDLEEKAQQEQYKLDQTHTLKTLKAEGLALHPIQVQRKTFGFADYPEVQFSLGFPAEQHFFRDNAPIECFLMGEEPVKGVLLEFNGKSGVVRLHAPDFPDWIEDNGVGIKLSPDTRTTTIMKNSLRGVLKNKTLSNLFEKIYGEQPWHLQYQPNTREVSVSERFNKSQQEAIIAMNSDLPVTIVHGPPGTGKTTTLIEGIKQLVQRGEKVLVSAPSNTAANHIARGLLKAGIKIARVGNAAKVSEDLFPHTPEGYMNDPKIQKEIKDLQIRAAAFRKMALTYKRQFGKAEREQRNLLFKEVRQIRDEIKKIQHYYEEKMMDQAAAVIGTPIGIVDAELFQHKFNTLVIDEAGQCLEPLGWTLFGMAEKHVLAGDPFQLPPTVISQEATQKGFQSSILERFMKVVNPVFLLNIQYRMRPTIAGFSSDYFYEGKLQSAPHLEKDKESLTFIDTAGSGFQENAGENGSSLQNEGELQLVKKLIEELGTELPITFITPYSGQTLAASQQLPSNIKVSTIDSFQGQEQETIIISLVRSNDEGIIGFLSDYRRMNVAMTRAKQKLIVIGDSATIGNDPFYKKFMEYVEKEGVYKSVWEYDLF